MTSPIRILYLIDTLRAGGKERQLLELLSGLASLEDIHAELVVLSSDIFYPALQGLELRKHFLVRKGKKDLTLFSRLYRICRNFRPHILHSWDSMSSVYAAPVARMIGARFVNGMIRHAPARLDPLSRHWLRARCTFPLSDVIVANSYAGIASFRAPRERSVCVHNGFDRKRVQNLERREVMRERLGIGTPKVVGMVAAFSPRKDYEAFVSAAQRILEGRNDVTFVAVGDGPDRRRIEGSVEPRFQDNIRFLGKRSDVESIVNVFDIGMLLTCNQVHGEGISNSIMEYMALGKPVVATEGGGTQELLIDGETGFLVRPADSPDLCRKVEFLLEHPDQAQKMGEAGRERIEQSFSSEQMTQSFLEIYHRLLPWWNRAE